MRRDGQSRNLRHPLSLAQRGEFMASLRIDHLPPDLVDAEALLRSEVGAHVPGCQASPLLRSPGSEVERPDGQALPAFRIGGDDDRAVRAVRGRFSRIPGMCGYPGVFLHNRKSS